MVELLVLAALGFAALVVVGTLATTLSLVFLPFRIMGWMIKGLGLVLMLPVMLLFGFLGFLIFGFGLVVFLVPLVPFALLVFLVWRLVRRPRSSATVSS